MAGRPEGEPPFCKCRPSRASDLFQVRKANENNGRREQWRKYVELYVTRTVLACASTSLRAERDFSNSPKHLRDGIAQVVFLMQDLRFLPVGRRA